MQKVIDHLEKELERQNLLIATDENIKRKRKRLDVDVLPSDVFKHMYQFRDELEHAISILKVHSLGA